MKDFCQKYIIQTRREIDTEKQHRDSLLNFAIAVMGALGFGVLQNDDLPKLLSHPAVGYIGISILLIITSLFWVRRKKLQQIADRWFVLWHLAKKYPEEFPNPSLESLVCPNLTRWTYTVKDTVLAIALSSPVYVLAWFSQSGPRATKFVIPVHILATIALLFRGLKDKTRDQQAHPGAVCTDGR